MERTFIIHNFPGSVTVNASTPMCTVITYICGKVMYFYILGDCSTVSPEVIMIACFQLNQTTKILDDWILGLRKAK